ncbi:hypothetical protein ACFE04_022314 [Oxalis oulophora]
MANHDLILGQTHNVELGQNQQLGLEEDNHDLGIGGGQSHNLDIEQSPGHQLGSGQTHDRELDLEHDHGHELGIGQIHDCEDGNDDDDGDDGDDRNYVNENDLSMDEKSEHEYTGLALTVHQNNDLGFSENSRLAISDNQQLDENMDHNTDMSIVPYENMIVDESQFAAHSPVVQTRTVAISDPNYELSVGQEFPDVKSCRRALRNTAIALHFEIQTIKSDKTRFTAKCAAEGCPWRIHAAKLPGVPTFTIRTIHENHTCGGISHLGHQQASVQWVATKVLEIEDISQDAAYWIRRIPPRLWATSYFEGARFGHLTANIVDPLNSWILEASGLPIIQMMECIRRQLMTWFNERRETSMQWTSKLVPSGEMRMAEALDRARTYEVLKANDAEFEVISHEGTNVVDIKNRCCLCRGWQLYGLPCSHAVAALLSCRQPVHSYAESCFTVGTYRKAYSQTIHPVPDKSLWKEFSHGTESETSITINPIDSGFLQEKPSMTIYWTTEFIDKDMDMDIRPKLRIESENLR